VLSRNPIFSRHSFVYILPNFSRVFASLIFQWQIIDFIYFTFRYPTHGDGGVLAQRTNLARALMMPRPHHEDREESKHDGDDGGSSAGRHVWAASDGFQSAANDCPPPLVPNGFANSHRFCDFASHMEMDAPGTPQLVGPPDPAKSAVP
jgi:hypothetical protein